MRVLGVDPGLTRCGVGVVEGVPGRAPRLVDVLVICTPAGDPLPERLLSIEVELARVIDRLQPDAVAVERVFSQHNVRTVMGTAQASAVAMLAAARRGLPVGLHTPSEVKAAVTGNGRAGKDQVGEMVTRLLRLADRPRPADAADALALAICHLWRGPAVQRLTLASAASRPAAGGSGAVIATVRGAVATVTLDSAVIEVGGVGILVHAAPGTLAELVPGEPARLATSLVVREDSLTLFGFLTEDERSTFELVQTVSGIGPRLALAMLAVHSPDGLRRAVAADDLVALTRVPGIGRKGAQRLVLELKDRLGPPGSQPEQASVPALRETDGRPQVRDALVGLGWSAKAADDALDQVLAGAGPGPDAAQGSSVDVAALLRAALRQLGRT